MLVPMLLPRPRGWTPRRLPGLAAWMHGTAPSYSDSGGTTRSAAPLGRVSKVSQPAPLSGYWTASSDPVRPVKTVGGVECLFLPNGTGLTAPNFATTVAGNDATIGLSFAKRQASLIIGDQTLFFSVVGGDAWGVILYSQADEIRVKRGGFQGDFATGIVVPPMGRCAVVIRLKSGGAIDVIADVNGTVYTASESHTLSSSPVANGGTISLSAGWDVGVDVAECVIGAGACSDADRSKLLAYLTARTPSPLPPVGAPLLVVTGDSIAAGPSPRASWPYLIMDNLYTANANVGLRLNNAAVAGYTLSQMKAAYIQYLRQTYNPARGKNVCVIAGGVNDLRATTDDVAFASLADIAQTIRADGWYTVVQTVANATSPNVNPTTFNPRQAGYNAAVKSVAVSGGTAYGVTYPKFADAVADVQAVPELADPTNTTYFADGLHWTSAGHAAARATYQAATGLP